MHQSIKMPVKGTIKGRSSTITNAFINAIIPVVNPSDEEVEKVLRILGMDKNGPVCAYCGDKYTQWDHFRPLVVDKEHNGFISEIANLVPCCSTCNSSKGNKNWEDWIRSDAKRSPKTRKVKDLEERIERLKKFEKWSKPTKITIANIVGKKKIEKYWKKYQEIMQLFDEAQDLANELADEVAMSNMNKEEMVVMKEEFSKYRELEKKNKNQVLERLINSVGMNFFIDHYHELLDLSIPNKVLIERLLEDYTNKSKASRVSKGRRIIREGLAKDALLKISNAKKVDDDVREEAEELLKSYDLYGL